MSESRLNVKDRNFSDNTAEEDLGNWRIEVGNNGFEEEANSGVGFACMRKRWQWMSTSLAVTEIEKMLRAPRGTGMEGIRAIYAEGQTPLKHHFELLSGSRVLLYTTYTSGCCTPYELLMLKGPQCIFEHRPVQ